MWSIEKLQEVWQLASELHNGQKYASPKKGQKVEYLNHIGSVTFEVLAATQLDASLDADLALHCAVLHDTIEDTSQSYEGLEERFGKAIAQGVLALTKNESLPTKTAQMQDSLTRIRQQPKEVWAVKMADRICNLQEPPHYWSREKRVAYQQEAQLIYTQLHLGNLYLAQRLQEKIAAYEQYFDKSS
ncbi:MAG: HD domain-containing protein [Aureispira sp.]